MVDVVVLPCQPYAELLNEYGEQLHWHDHQEHVMLRVIGQFFYNLISGTAVHLIAMLLGVLLTLIVFGKTQESLLHLILAVFIPFMASGAFIARRRLRWAPTISVLSAALALTVPPIAISAYWGWNWSTLGSDYWWVLTGIPCSLVGCWWQQGNHGAETPGVSTDNPNNDQNTQ